MKYIESKNILATGHRESFFQRFRVEQLMMLPFLSTIYSILIVFFYIRFSFRYLSWALISTMNHEQLDLDIKKISFKGYFHELVLLLNAFYWFALPNNLNDEGIFNYMNYHLFYWISSTYNHTATLINHIN